MTTVRIFRRSPRFALAVIVILSLGIGITTALFSIVNAVLLRTPSWPSADRLVAVYAVELERQGIPRYAARWNREPIRRVTWEALQRAPVFDAVGVWQDPWRLFLGPEGREFVEAMPVSAGFLQMLGVTYAVGRGFIPSDDAAPTGAVILSRHVWQAYYGSNPDVVGRTILLRGEAARGPNYHYVVVGVLAQDLEFASIRPDVLLAVGELAHSPMSYYNCVARLQPGVGLKQAEAVVGPLMSRAETRARTSGRLVPLAGDQVRLAATPLLLLFGGAALLLLVSCANVAGLVLSETQDRSRELAIRGALGATRWAIARQLAVENFALAAVSALIGLLLVGWLGPLFASMAPADVPRLREVGVDWRVAAFAIGSGLLTLVVATAAPSIFAGRLMRVSLSSGFRLPVLSTRQTGQRLFLSSQVALVLALVAGAGLFGRTFLRLAFEPPPFNPKGLAVVSAWFSLNPSAPEQGSNWRAAGIRALASVHGVEGVAAATAAPFLGDAHGISARTVTGGGGEVRVQQQVVSSQFFDILGMHAVRGRLFGKDSRPTDKRAVVSATFQKVLFPAGAVGRRFVVRDDQVFEIVGVIEDLTRRTIGEDPVPTFYTLDGPSRPRWDFIVRTHGDSHGVLADLRSALKSGSAPLVVRTTSTMEDVMASSYAAERFRVTLASCFAASALALAAIGLYGFTRRVLVNRRKELAIRVALGADPGRLARAVIGDAFLAIVVGLPIGLALAVASGRIASGLIPGVENAGAWTMALAVLTTVIACGLPTLIVAAQATAVSPMHVLRDER